MWFPYGAYNTYHAHPIVLCIIDNPLSQTVQRISEFPTDSGNLTLFYGETAILNCSSVTNNPLTQYFWRRGNDSLVVCPVFENPFCVPSNHTIRCGSQLIPIGGCRNDPTRVGQQCKRERVHSYSYLYNTVEDCVYRTQTKRTTMMINAVTWSDAGVYTCIPSSGSNNKTMNVTVGQFTVVKFALAS